MNDMKTNKDEDMDMSRLEANRKIIGKLAEVVEQFPDWRFGQILQNVNIVKKNGFSIVDTWFEESTETLENMQSFR